MQVATAVGEGARAAMEAAVYFKKVRKQDIEASSSKGFPQVFDQIFPFRGIVKPSFKFLPDIWTVILAKPALKKLICTFFVFFCELNACFSEDFL